MLHDSGPTTLRPVVLPAVELFQTQSVISQLIAKYQPSNWTTIAHARRGDRVQRGRGDAAQACRWGGHNVSAARGCASHGYSLLTRTVVLFEFAELGVDIQVMVSSKRCGVAFP
jgi:hypothetical protein